MNLMQLPDEYYQKNQDIEVDSQGYRLQEEKFNIIEVPKKKNS